jgi:hypothetical protein
LNLKVIKPFFGLILVATILRTLKAVHMAMSSLSILVLWNCLSLVAVSYGKEYFLQSVLFLEQEKIKKLQLLEET